MRKITIKEVKENVELEEQFIEQNLKLVWEVVHRHFNHENLMYTKEDYYQIGCIGLIKAAREFDIDKGFKFSTYAFPKIWGEINRHKRDHSMSILTVPRSIKEKFIRIKQLEMQSKNVNEIIDELGITYEEYGRIINVFCFYYSLDKRIDSEDSKSVIEFDNFVYDEGFEDEYVNNDYCNCIIELLKKDLNEIQYRIFQLRYIHNLGQVEIAKMVGLSQAHISRILKYIEKIVIPKVKSVLDGEITQEDMENQKIDLGGKLYAKI